LINGPLKISVLATVTDFGGAEKVVLSLIKNINCDLFELVPIIFTKPSLINNIFSKELDKTSKRYHTIFVNSYKIKYLNPLVNIIETYKLLKKDNLNLIHTHGYRADVIGISLAKLMGLPVVSTCHGFISNDINLALYNKLDRFVLRFAHKIIAVSIGIKNDLIRSGINESHLLMIQNAVEVNSNLELFIQNRRNKRQEYNLTEKEFVIGYIGRLSEEKGVKYLIEATSMLNDLNRFIRVLIIGEGPQKKELEDLVKKVNMEDKIFFVGFQSDIENWLPAIDVFVLPSLTEGTPMSLLEAMANGIPVVASAVGGVPQVVDSGKNGILVAPGKPEEIVDAVNRLYQDETLRKTVHEEGKKTIELKFNASKWIKQIEAEYLKIIQKAGK